MAKLNELINYLGKQTLPLETMRIVRRELVKSGHLPAGSVGRYGDAEAGPREAAILITALVGADDRVPLTRLGEAVDLLWPFRLDGWFRPGGVRKPVDPPQSFYGVSVAGHTFGEAMIGIFETAAKSYVMDTVAIDISVTRPMVEASIEVMTSDMYVVANYISPLAPGLKYNKIGMLLPDSVAAQSEFYGPNDYTVSRKIGVSIIRDIGLMLRN